MCAAHRLGHAQDEAQHQHPDQQHPPTAAGSLRGVGQPRQTQGEKGQRRRGVPPRKAVAIATIALVEILRVTTLNQESLGGAVGIFGIPQPFLDPQGYALFTLIALALVCWLCDRLERQRLGRAMEAIRDDELAAACQGIDTDRTKLVAFVLSAVVAAITGVSAWVMKQLRRSNPWFVGALVASIVLATNQIMLSSIPTWMTNGAQMVIGVSLGVRFTSQFVHTAPRWLMSVAVGTLSMIVLCALFSLVLSQLTQLPVATMILASAPGGIAEMAITAKVLQLGVAVVTALQVCRVIAVLFLADPLFRWLRGRGHF